MLMHWGTFGHFSPRPEVHKYSVISRTSIKKARFFPVQPFSFSLLSLSVRDTFMEKPLPYKQLALICAVRFAVSVILVWTASKWRLCDLFREGGATSMRVP